MEAKRETHVGRACKYVNPVGREFDALITAVWGPQCVNLTYVDPDPEQHDSYGNKLRREPTSLMHKSIQQAHGQFWYIPGED